MPGTNVYISSGGATGAGAAAGAAGATSGASQLGGAMSPVSSYLGAGLGLLQAYGTYAQNSQIADTQGYEDLYTEFGNQDYNGDFNDLIHQRRKAFLGEAPSWRKLSLMNTGAKVGSAISSAGSGAMAGSAFGPWGAAVGALVGLGASILGSQTGDAKAKTEAGRLRLLREKALINNQKNFLSGVKNAEQNVNFTALSNIAAFGGPLDFGIIPIGGAIDYELAQRRLAQKDLELKKALGGSLHTHGADWTNGVIFINNGGTHESNPFEGVPMGLAPDGKPNLVEEGEVIFNDYVFSNRIKVPKAVREKYKLRGQKEMTFADAAKKAQKESEERPNDPISKRGLNDIMGKLMFEQEALREQRQNRQYAKGGNIHIDPSKKGTFTAAASKHNMGVQEFASKVLANPEDYSPAMRKKANFARNASKWKHDLGGPIEPFNIPDYEYGKYVYKFEDVPEPKPYTPMRVNISSKPLELVQQPKRKWFDTKWLRYAPALGTGILTLTDAFGLTNKPDYTGVNSILEAAREGEGNIKDVTFNPIGNYLAYKPFDTMFYGNQLASQAAATRRAIKNNANGNRMTAIAGLLGADYNAQTQLGNLYRQAEEYNLAQRERVAAFNRGTNMFNAENDLKAQMANNENAKIKVEAAAKAAAIRDAVDTRVSAARSANLTNLFDNLGNIGIDAYNRKDRDMLIRAGVFGTLSQKPQEWSQKRWEEYQKAVSERGYRDGGILKKRKGITI